MSKVIMGIQIDTRSSDALEVQKLLGENGCIIKTRLGLHEASKENQVCSQQGLVILEFVNGAEKEIAKLESALSKIERVSVQKMAFDI